MEHELIIRKATSTDLETLLTFEQGIVETERPYDVTLKRNRINYYDLKSMISDPDAYIAVAELNHSIIASGYAIIKDAKPYLQHHQYAYLGFMYVIPDHRGRGINAKILSALKDWSHSKGIYEIRLDVYVKNQSAIRAYEKMGFEMHLVEMRLK